jgi:hypothetical protein
MQSVEARESLANARDHLTVDELLLPPRRLAQGCGGEPVDLAQRALRQLVEHGEGIAYPPGSASLSGST